MSTDRELLELAAKAYWGAEIDDVCSIEWDDADQCIAYTHADNQDHNGNDQAFLWNPLADDGDALRLAVKCGLVIDTSRPSSGEPFKTHHFAQEDFKDPLAATRRAITRAAAAIGEQK